MSAYQILVCCDSCVIFLRQYCGLVLKDFMAGIGVFGAVWVV